MTNQPEDIYSVTLTLSDFVPVLNALVVSHLIYLSVTKPTVQQFFLPRAKHLLVFLDILFVLMHVKPGTFCQFTVLLLISV